MISSRFLQVSFLTAVLFLLPATGLNKRPTPSRPAATLQLQTANAEPVAVSTIVTTPENMVVTKTQGEGFRKMES
jgi:hypothetical protein